MSKKKKIPFNHSLKFKINAIAFIIFILIIALFLVKSYYDQSKLIGMHEDTLNSIAADTINRRFKVSYEILETGLIQVLNNREIIDAFAERDRQSLRELTVPTYEQLKDAGVTQFHFHLPDNTSFFRVHSPAEYGDDLNGFRQTIVDLNSDPDHTPITGIEEGVHGLSLRRIEPIHQNNTYLGSVELGMAIDTRILNIFKNVSGGQWFLYSLNESGVNLLTGTAEKDPFADQVIPAEKLKSGATDEISASPYTVQTIPIPDYEGNYNYFFKRVFNNTGFINMQRNYSINSFLYGLVLAILGMVSLRFILKKLLFPLTELEDRIRDFEKGAVNESLEIDSNCEIGYLAKVIEKMRQSIIHRENRLKKLSYHDPLTGVNNRHYMKVLFERFTEEKLYPISILIADIDGLKQLNDQEGHLVGDKYIKLCAKVMKGAIRETDYLCRIGGDEFAFLLPSTDEKVARKIRDRIKNEIADYNRTLKEDKTPLSVSIGVATCGSDCDSLESIMGLADKRMYKNKIARRSVPG